MKVDKDFSRADYKGCLNRATALFFYYLLRVLNKHDLKIGNTEVIKWCVAHPEDMFSIHILIKNDKWKHAHRFDTFI